MLREIREEEKVLETTVSRNDLRIELGLDPLEDTKPKPKVNSSKKNSSKRKRVGEPKPKRRKIGDAQDAD